MPKVIKFKKLIKILNDLGYFEERRRGSHIIYKNSVGNVTVVPKHSNGEVRGGLLGKIIKDIEISNEDFEKLRN